MHGNDWHIEPFDDLFKASFERLEVPGAANRPFGEDADDMALMQIVLGAGEGGGDFSRVPPLYGDWLHLAQQPVQGFVLVDRSVDEKADEALDAPPDQESVNERDVVAHQQGGTTHGDVLLPD